MPIDRVEQLTVFLRVAATGSFTKTADQLALPRPTVSLAVQQLEARLGVRLFYRTTRSVTLTQDGEAMVERANALVNDMQELEARFRPSDQGLSGRLRVEVPSRIARLVIAPHLPAWLAEHPGLALDLGSSDRRVDLVQESVDCALREARWQTVGWWPANWGRWRWSIAPALPIWRAMARPRRLMTCPATRW